MHTLRGTRAHTCAHALIQSADIHTCAHTSIHTQKAHLYIHTLLPTYACALRCRHTHMCAHIYTHARTEACIHVLTHSYTHSGQGPWYLALHTLALRCGENASTVRHGNQQANNLPACIRESEGLEMGPSVELPAATLAVNHGLLVTRGGSFHKAS